MHGSSCRRFFSGDVITWRVLAWLATASISAAAALGEDSARTSRESSGLQTVAQVSRQQAALLEPGKPLAGALSAGEIHHYQLKLQKGQCAQVRVEQRGVNVTVQLFAPSEGPGNDSQIEVDDELGKHGTEKLDFVADNNGMYTVAVKPKWKARSGAYEIRLDQVRTAGDGDQTLSEARELRTKARRLLDLEKPAEALPLADRALALAQKTLGSDDAYVALLTRDLADATYASAKLAEAKPLYERALQTLTSKLGADHPQTVRTEDNLGYLNVDLENFSKADKFLRHALESEERLLGADDPLLAGTLTHLGILHLHLADFVAAEHEFQRALEILEGAGAVEGAQYGHVLNDLGIVNISRRNLQKAALYLERSLAFQEKKLGPDSPALWRTLNNLGIVARKRKDYPAAERYYQRALAIQEKTVGRGHPDYALTLSNLGNVYQSEGDYRKALEAHLRILGMFENVSPTASERRQELEDIQTLYAALGDFKNAIKIQSQMEAGLESEIAFNLAIGSERQKLGYLDSVASDMDDTISLHLEFQPDNAEAAALAATAVLRRKGRVLDAMTDTVGALRRRADPQDQVLLDQLKEVTTQYARSVLQGPQKRPLDEYRRALQDQQEKKERLENTISHHNEEFRAQLQPVTQEAVGSAIPGDAALVEFVTYSPYNPKAPPGPDQYGRPHYAAYVLHQNAAPKGVDLGEASTVDGAVEKLRAALREPNRDDVQKLGREVAAKVFDPLRSLVADGKRLLISPDGQLNLIPFEALLDDQNRYLVERFSISYLTTGRDLLRMQVPRPSRSAPVIVADPLFGEPKETLVASAGMPQAKPHPRIGRRSVTVGTDFSSLYFAPLEGTKAEARSIQGLFPEAQVLTGERASQAALEQLNAPEMLHIATHGFFLQDTSEGSGAGGNVTAGPENPLLRSGLALRGANLVKDGKGDGILTALEASNLNLWGTRLVTLSACDTGVGEVKDREGVYGLRRSFFLAGAETLVMSLWPVSDYVTREMMTSYYSGLKHGLGRGEALRQAQLAMLKHKGREHPFYWASFIQSGEWANLDGQR